MSEAESKPDAPEFEAGPAPVDAPPEVAGPAEGGTPEASGRAASIDTRPRDHARLPRVSMRLRLTLWVVVIFSLIQWTLGGVFWLYQRNAIREMFDERLLGWAWAIAGDVGDERLPIDSDLLRRIVASELGGAVTHTVVVDIADSTGASVVAGRHAPIDAEDLRGMLDMMETGSAAPVFAEIARAAPKPAANQTGGALPTTMRAVAIPLMIDGERHALTIGSPLDALARPTALVTRAVLVGGLAGSVAAAIAGWFIAGIAVAPFERLRMLAKQLRPESISRAIEVDSSNQEVSRLAEELEDARRRLGAAFASQERFLSNVSHEIKTPISVMLVEAQTLDRAGLPEHAAEFAESVADEMVRLGRLVESFLTLTRIGHGPGLASMRSVGVNDLIMDSCESCAVMADQHAVILEPLLLAEEETLDATVRGEPDLLRTMLDNLVRNALRFSPEHSRVRIAATVLPSGTVRIEVSDEGPGIPPDRLETIFDRFAQAPEGERKGRGHGLGLTIAQGIAELHGGRISAENLPDRGAKFIVRLPLPGSGSIVDEDEGDGPLTGGDSASGGDTAPTL